MKDICPNCEKISKLDIVSKPEKIKVKNEDIEIECRYLVCDSCHAEFEDPKEKTKPIELAYRIYRSKHNLLQPEDIKEFRKKHGLTQQEISLLLGWGLTTLSRYENGALQDECHEKELQLAMDPYNLIKLVQKSSGAISEEKRLRLIKELENERNETHSFVRMCEDRFGQYQPNIYSGYRKLNISKLFSAILFFCSDGALKTVLNKLLFYADFLHFKKYSVSITGVCYAHATYGPVPDNYEYYYATLIHEEKSLKVEEKDFSKDITGELFYAQIKPDLNMFEESELDVLLKVKNYFKGFSATQIKNISHNEVGYKKTDMGNSISYNYAMDIKIMDNYLE